MDSAIMSLCIKQKPRRYSGKCCGFWTVAIMPDTNDKKSSIVIGAIARFETRM
jgi:hypothetical protein